jgi:tRNA pseudouridine38-40 synthase
MSFVRVDLAYKGNDFAGWAAQPGRRTVQAELESALLERLGEPVRMRVAGRTDAGVHAWGQVASFELAGREPPEDLARSMQALTPHDIAVLGARTVPDGFDARYDATSRTYCYRLYAAPVPSPFERGLSLFWPHTLYPAMLGHCAEALLGTHDFEAFTPTRTERSGYERTVIRAEWKRGQVQGDRGRAQAQLLEFWIEADSFLHNMVRAIVGTMMEVGSGRRPLDHFTSLLKGGQRPEAGETAHPQGLYLASVAYGGPRERSSPASEWSPAGDS